MTTGLSLEECQDLFDTYWERNWAIKKVASDLTVQEIDGQKWILNPISNLWYSLRSDNDRFSTLVQGSASFAFDWWLSFVLKEWDILIGQFHDELIMRCKKEEVNKVEEILSKAIEQTNARLKLNRRLDIGIQSKQKYSEIH